MNIYRILIVVMIVGAASISSATIIHIPDDYSTIQSGVDAALEGDTVLVQPGSYVENVSIVGHNIVLASLYLTTRDTSYIDMTIIDGDSLNSTVIISNSQNQSSILCGFTIIGGFAESGAGGGIECTQANPTIRNNIIRDNYGGGIFINRSSPIIEDNKIHHNAALFTGGGISCLWQGNPIIRGNIIYNNFAGSLGGGFYTQDATPIITNNTVCYNLTNGNGGGIFCRDDDPTLINNIFWGNSGSTLDEICYLDCWPLITYCDIRGGWEGEGVIADDPLFIDPNNGDFHLQANSPCIDTGDPTSPHDPDSTRADIGALYYDQTVSIDDITYLPESYQLLQNYPNPFNASTRISYSLPEASQVKLDIYDLLGRKLACLYDGYQAAGEHHTNWNASEYPSGTYFAKISYSGRTKSIKMLLIK